MIGAGLGAALGSGHCLAVYEAWRPTGIGIGLDLSMYAMRVLLKSAGLGVLFGLLGLLFRRSRAVSSRLLGGCAALLTVILLSSLPESWLRQQGLARLIHRGTPLLEAILRFEAERGEPPAQLEDLVPHYVNLVPSTGTVAFPRYLFVRGDSDQPGRWWLSVPTGATIMSDFTSLEFDPTGQYPPHARLVGRWAVVTEGRWPVGCTRRRATSSML